MKRTAIISLISILAILGLYFFWEYNNQPLLQPWDLVPNDAVIAYQHHKNSDDDPTDLLTASFIPDSLRNLVLTNELLLSAHLIGKEEVGIVLYLLAPSPLMGRLDSAIKLHHPLRERVFDGFKISESTVGNQSISTTLINKVWVMSPSSILIEDIIRLANAKEKNNFVTHHHEVFQFAKAKLDSGLVYFDFSILSKTVDVFLLEKNQIPILNYFAKSAAVEIKRQKENLLLNGFVIDSLSDHPSTLSLFDHQKPVPITLPRIISNRSGVLVHFGISDFPAWNQDRLEFCKAANPAILDSLALLNDQNGFKASQLYQTFGNEIVVCQSGIFSGEILVVELKDKALAASQLQKLQRKSVANQPSGETYSHYQIHFLNYTSLPNTLFWPLTSRKMNYYLFTDRHLLFSEKLDDLKSFVSDLETDNTWGKSSEWNEFLSSTPDTNVGIIFDASTWWPSLQSHFNPKWKNIVETSRFPNLNRGSLQFSRLEKNYYFNGAFRLNSRNPKIKSDEKAKMVEVTLPQQISSPLTVVRNHTSGRGELLVQDDLNTLRLFSGSLKTLFSIKILGKIESDIFQIDYYKNKKLQYLFATEHQLYIVDRLGNPVKGFPKAIAGKEPIRFLSLIDFNHSKNYQFLLCDSKGTMFKLDMEGKPVQGWKKIELNSELLSAPRALKLMGRDYLVAITRDGRLYCFNQNESIKGFPVNLKIRPAGKFIFESLNDREVITVVTEDGVLIQIDLNGNVINKTNFIKSTATSRFSLIPTVEQAKYVVSRIDKNMIAVLNGKGEVLFETPNPGSEELFLNYFELNGGRKLFAFNDPQQEFTYFYDDKGQSVFSRPLENQGVPSVISDKPGEEYFYCFTKNKLRSFRPALKTGK